ncbi:MAG: hypothetical protein QXH24_00100 [Candidatus Bathyarchaeia archaeon]
MIAWEWLIGWEGYLTYVFIISTIIAIIAYKKGKTRQSGEK